MTHLKSSVLVTTPERPVTDFEVLCALDDLQRRACLLEEMKKMARRRLTNGRKARIQEIMDILSCSDGRLSEVSVSIAPGLSLRIFNRACEVSDAALTNKELGL